MSVYKLYGLNTISVDGISQLDIQFDGHIVAYSINAGVTAGNALGDGFIIEASFLSGSMFDNNDARGIIAMALWRQAFLTTGGGVGSVNVALSGLAIPVNAGERIYAHLKVNGTPGSVEFVVLMYVEDSSDPLLRRRR